MTSGCEAKRHTGKIECRRYQGQRGRRQGGEELGEKAIYSNRSCRQCLFRSSDGRGRRQRRKKKNDGEEDEATRATLLYTRSGWGPCGTWDHEWDVSWLTCPRAEEPESDVLGSTCQTWMGKLPLTLTRGAGRVFLFWKVPYCTRHMVDWRLETGSLLGLGSASLGTRGTLCGRGTCGVGDFPPAN